MNLDLEALGAEPFFPRRLPQQIDDFTDVKLSQVLTILAVQVAVRKVRDPIIPSHAVTDIDLLSQPDLADQLEIPPDRAVADGRVLRPDFFIKLINRDMIAQLEKGTKDHLPLGSHLKPFCSQELAHCQRPFRLIENDFHFQLSAIIAKMSREIAKT